MKSRNYSKLFLVSLVLTIMLTNLLAMCTPTPKKPTMPYTNTRVPCWFVVTLRDSPDGSLSPITFLAHTRNSY